MQRLVENQQSLNPESLQNVKNSRCLLSTVLTVQSSFNLKIPPHLIIPSSIIKLVEAIGQGMYIILVHF